VLEVGAKLQVFFPDFSNLVGDGVELWVEGHYGRDRGIEDREDRAFANCDGLKCERGGVLDKVGVELEAVPGLRKTFLPGRPEWEKGGLREMVIGAQETEGVGAGDGSGQGLIAWGNGWNLHQGTE